MTWKTKPSDRFVLKFIKERLSAPLSSALVRLVPGVSPFVITPIGLCLGIGGGVAFGLGHAFAGGLLAAAAQIFDGMDGQVARLTCKETTVGAFLDSVLDRVVDFALLFGIVLYCMRCSAGLQLGGLILTENWIVAIGGVAAIGISQVSYATARAASLKLPYRRPEYAGKGTRTSVVVLCGILTPVWTHFPLIALLYVAVHPNAAIIRSLSLLRGSPAGSPDP